MGPDEVPAVLEAGVPHSSLVNVELHNVGKKLVKLPSIGGPYPKAHYKARIRTTVGQNPNNGRPESEQRSAVHVGKHRAGSPDAALFAPSTVVYVATSVS